MRQEDLPHLSDAMGMFPTAGAQLTPADLENMAVLQVMLTKAVDIITDRVVAELITADRLARHLRRFLADCDSRGYDQPG